MDILFGRSQLPVFISFVVCGIISGAFCDILKIKRRMFSDRLIFLFFDDLIFFAFCTLLVIFNAYCFNDGNLKWYEIPFMITGFVLYRKTASPLFVGLCYFLIDCAKRLLQFILTPFTAFYEYLLGTLKICKEEIYLYFFMCRKKRVMSCGSFAADFNGKD